MPQGNMIKLLQLAAKDQQLIEQIANAPSYEDVQRLAQERGCDLSNVTKKDAQRTFAVATGAIGKGELTEREMEMIAGGILIDFVGAGFKSEAPKRVKWYIVESSARQSPYIGETEKN